MTDKKDQKIKKISKKKLEKIVLDAKLNGYLGALTVKKYATGPIYLEARKVEGKEILGRLHQNIFNWWELEQQKASFENLQIFKFTGIQKYVKNGKIKSKQQ